jgi:tetratricopeptide (TPR) repeat protein
MEHLKLLFASFKGERSMKGFATGNGCVLLILAILFGLLSACGPRYGGYPYSVLGTPEQHVFNGFAFLRKERLADAQREFDQALLLDPKSSPAFRGMGLTYGMKGEFSRAFDEMGRARAYGKDLLDQALAEVGMMSLYRMEKKDGWLIRVEEGFSRAVSLVGQLPEAYLELGVAYKYAYRFQEAEESFNEVLKINTFLLFEAGEELDLLRKIEKAGPGSAFGKELVLKKSITRGETAGLIGRETRLVESLTRKTGPGGEASSKAQAPAVPADVMHHPMKADILAVLGLNIRGLGTLYDGSFGVDQTMTRAAFATVMADVLIRAAGKPELYQKYAGINSPFLDVRGNSPYFSSVLICSEWAGIMGGWSGYFHPMETISGVDALLVLRQAEKKMEGN